MAVEKEIIVQINNKEVKDLLVKSNEPYQNVFTTFNVI